MKTLFVGGTFNDLGGKSSYLMYEIIDSFRKRSEEEFYEYTFVLPEDFKFLNGGEYQRLEEELQKKFDVIYWFADIPNDKPKLVNKIKEYNKECILVTSKVQRENQTLGDVIAHALNIKSNLILEISKNDNYAGRIIDPLGNLFVDYETDFKNIGKILQKRVNELRRYHRVSSIKLSSEYSTPVMNKEFLEIVQQSGEIFHNLLEENVQTKRYLGNASFRCGNGFPSFRENGQIFVSRRNLDKRGIREDNFVNVQEHGAGIGYYGNDKPSVDSPIHVKLFNYYEKINYMIHGHVYIKDAPFTTNIVPCGALEEAQEVINVFPYYNTTEFFAINLRGHGCLIGTNDVEKFYSIPFVPRPFPENHPRWKNE